jgi:hypothetical protein
VDPLYRCRSAGEEYPAFNGAEFEQVGGAAGAAGPREDSAPFECGQGATNVRPIDPEYLREVAGGDARPRGREVEHARDELAED